MPVTYASFRAKFDGFTELLEPQFNAWLVDVTAEVDSYKWNVLGNGFNLFREQAIENLLACKLSRLNPEYLGSAGLAEFEVKEAAYRVKYLSNSGGGKDNPFCDEYRRLLDKVAKLDPDASKLPACTHGVVKKVYWG